MMHPDTIAALRARLLAELADDPTGRGYAGLGAADLAAALNAPVAVEAPTAYRDVLVSDVEGYLAARLLLVGLEDWVAAAEAGTPRQAARQLLQIIQGGRLRVFLTSDAARRVNVLAMFASLCGAGAGGLTMEHYADLAAMCVAPAGPPVVAPARWQIVIDGLSAEPGHAGPPNAASADLVEVLTNGG